MKKTKLLTTSITMILLFLIFSINVSAYSSFSGGATSTNMDPLNYSYTTSEAANSCFSYCGFTPKWLWSSSYTGQSVKSAMTYALCFYEYGHGADGRFWPNDNEVLPDFLLNYWRGGSYFRFVFCDSCNSSQSQSLANAFGIANGDGLNHAFLGWNGSVGDNLQYCNFTKYVFSSLRNGNSVYNAYQYASQNWGVYNGVMYGRPSFTKLN